MKKITTDFIISQYQSGVASYTDSTKSLGLWQSEEYVFEKYLNKTDYILDLGCGTGRTTFPLYQLGFQQIQGVDLTPEMIDSANALKEHYQVELNFQVGDARQLKYLDQSFDAVIFSFNGMMSIPSAQGRQEALQEINRVLKPQGVYIFTTHDREKDEKYFEFWKAQKVIWEQQQQDQRLYEFGDLITGSKNEDQQIYIHIPNQSEIENFLQTNGFEVLETFYRNDRFEESEQVKAKSGECRFWVTKKCAR